MKGFFKNSNQEGSQNSKKSFPKLIVISSVLVVAIAASVLVFTKPDIFKGDAAKESTNSSTEVVQGSITDIKRTDDTLDISIGSDKLLLQVCEPGIFKADFRPNGASDKETVVIGNPKFSTGNIKAADIDSDPIVIETAKMTIKISRKPCRISVYNENNELLIKEQDVKGAYSGGLNLDGAADSKFYGINGFDAFEDSSQGMLRNKGGKVEAGSQGDCGAPFVWSNKGYGVLIDSDGGNFEIKNTSISFTKCSKVNTEYFILVGNPTEILSSVATISGKPPMFPKWAMGFTNSEWDIDQKELIEIVDTYRKKQIPIDNYTLDFDWKAWGEDNYGEFRWNEEKFPDGPSGKLKKIMDSKGIKLSGITKPRIHVDSVQGKYATENNFWLPVAESADYFSNKMIKSIDFGVEAARKWFWESSVKAYDTGIVGWWNDEADLYNNTEFLNMQRAMYEGQRSYTNNRVWSINRNFYLGAQRYAYGVWSGDIKGGYDNLSAQRERMLSSINVGSMKWGMDAGSFSGICMEQEYARWIQFGAFTPVFRVHGTNGLQRQPWWYGETAEAASTKFIRFRYTMIPYLYSYERKAYETGIGLVKPLVFDYPNDEKVFNNKDSWMFGDYMLVSPVVAIDQTEKEIYLPAGTWYDYFKGTVYEGGKTITYATDAVKWDDVPLFIKKGAIIPTQDLMNYVGEKPVTKINIDVFPDSNKTSFKYYDDDGSTYDYEKGVYFAQTMTAKDDGSSMSFNIEEKQGSFTPALKYYIVKLHGKAGKTVTINSSTAKGIGSLEELEKLQGEGYATGKDLYGDVTYVKVLAGSAKNIVVNN